MNESEYYYWNPQIHLNITESLSPASSLWNHTKGFSFWGYPFTLQNSRLSFD